MAPKLVFPHEGIEILVYEQSIRLGNNTLWLKREVDLNDVGFIKAIFNAGMQWRSQQIVEAEETVTKLKELR